MIKPNQKYDIRRLSLKDKDRMVAELAAIMFYTYIEEEYINVTQNCYTLKNTKPCSTLLKDFEVKDFPFTTDMVKKVRNDDKFIRSNPNLCMDTYFQIKEDEVCASLCK